VNRNTNAIYIYLLNEYTSVIIIIIIIIIISYEHQSNIMVKNTSRLQNLLRPPSHRVRSLSVHDIFGRQGWTVSVHDDFSTYRMNFGTCVFCSTTSVHAKYHFGTSL